MGNLFDKFLTSLAKKGHSQPKVPSSNSKGTFLDKGVTYKKKSEELKSSLVTFNQAVAEPTKQNMESIMAKTPKSEGLLAAGRKIKLDMKIKAEDSSKYGKYGPTELKPFFPKNNSAPFSKPMDKMKEDAVEYMRSGRVSSEIEEIKKEWLMEETKTKRSITGGSGMTYEQAIKTERYNQIFKEAETKWDKLYATDRDSLVLSLEQQEEQSLLDEAKRKEEWIEGQLPWYLPKEGTFASRFSANDWREAYPDWYAKKEKEYYLAKDEAAYVGFAIKSFDKDLEGLLGKDEMARMEVARVLSTGIDPKKVLTSMSLDTINFEDIANIGQDVYTKDGKIYYKGFEIDDQYLTDEGKQAAYATDLISRFAGGMAPYAGISGTIKSGVFSLARAKDVPKLLTGVQKLSQAITWSSKTAPILTEMTTFNTLEEMADMVIRKGAGQDYTFEDFIAGITMGAGFAGTLSFLGKGVNTIELKQLVRDMETNVKDSKHLGSLRDMEFQGRPLNDWFMETRQVYYKGLDKSKIRPGIDKSAPLPGIQEKETMLPSVSGGKDLDKPKTSDVQSPLQSPSAGELRTRGLSRGVEAKAVEQSLTKGFGDLPQYHAVNMKDQADQATKLVANNYALAKDIAMGKKSPPDGVIPESLYVAVEKKALADGDVKTLKELATESRLTAEATEMGQRLRTLGERDPYSPVSKMKEIVRTREAVVSKKLKGRTATGMKKEIKVDLQKKIAKAKPTPKTWEDLLDELTC